MSKLSSDLDTASWMKLTTSKNSDSFNPNKWEDILVMFKDLIECFWNDTMLKLDLAKLEVMKEDLSQIKDVILDNSIGYKEAKHQESLVKKKLTKTLGHSSWRLFTLSLHWDTHLGGVFENGSKNVKVVV